MKRILTLAAVFVLALTVNSNAALVNYGNGMIYDTDLNITWLQDANYANTTGYDDALYGYDTGGRMIRDHAMAWAAQLEYMGFTDWRLPTVSNPPQHGFFDWWNQTDVEMGHLYYSELGNIAQDTSINTGPFINVRKTDGGPPYWTDTVTSFDLYDRFTFGFQNGGFGYQFKGDVYPSGLLTILNGPAGFAWAVRDGAPSGAPVPIPGAVWLLGSGLIGLIGLKSIRRIPSHPIG